MINKQGLWFLTLFSLILVLSIYYITMPDEMFLSNNNKVVKEEVTKEVTKEENKELNYIETLKVELKEERQELMQTLEEVLNSEATKGEKNNAYETLKNLTTLQGVEESIEKKLKDSCNLNTFVKSTDKEVSIVVESSEHDVKLANKIMRIVQEEYKEPMSISVKFS